MKSILVFCGAKSGNHPDYETVAYDFGRFLAQEGLKLVYGGAKIGLMGKVAEGALAAGGEVIGVIPSFLKTKEVAHDGLTDLIEVSSMHERKMKMHQLSDAIVALPGGVGTFEELFETITWGQLGLHNKAIGIFNCNGFFNPLKVMLETMHDSGFIDDVDTERIFISSSMHELLEYLKSHQSPIVKKWLHKSGV